VSVGEKIVIGQKQRGGGGKEEEENGLVGSTSQEKLGEGG